MPKPFSDFDFDNVTQQEKTVAKREQEQEPVNHARPEETENTPKEELRGRAPHSGEETNRAARKAGKDLTAKEFRLFALLIHPEHWGKPLRELAEMAGVSEAFAYKAAKRPHVQEACHAFVIARLGTELPKIMEAAIRTALIIGKEGYGDRKMLMSMAGLQTDRRSVDHKHDHVHDIGQRLAQATMKRKADLAQIKRSGALDVMFDDGSGTPASQSGAPMIEPPADQPLAAPDPQLGEQTAGLEEPGKVSHDANGVDGDAPGPADGPHRTH